MDISVIGAGGAIGREIVAQIVSSRVLRPTERLQLVGNATGTSARSLYGFRSDLTDAYTESAPQIDIGLCPEDVVGDLIVFVAGATLGEKPVSRDSLALINRDIFEKYAYGLSRHGHGHEIVLVVTNPVELGVSIFAEALGYKRVIGIGAYSDTLRFRREIAYDLGMPRQMVAGYVVGEHGDNMVPLWSSVRIYGFTQDETDEVVMSMQGKDPTLSFAKRLNQMRSTLHTVTTQDTRAAFDEIDQMPPDIRVVLRPHITQQSGSRTVMATSNVTVDMTRQIVGGNEMSVAGQVLLENTGFCGTKGVFGVPIILSSQGVMRVINPPVTELERKAILQASKTIQAKIANWRSL